MEMFKFTRDGITKECHCHEGVREALKEAGWEEVKAKLKSKPKVKKKDD